jgi:hypothetical protein
MTKSHCGLCVPQTCWYSYTHTSTHFLMIPETHSHGVSDPRDCDSAISAETPSWTQGECSQTPRHRPRIDPNSHKLTHSMSFTPTFSTPWSSSTCATFLCCSTHWPRTPGLSANDKHASHEHPCSTKRSKVMASSRSHTLQIVLHPGLLNL